MLKENQMSEVQATPSEAPVPETIVEHVEQAVEAIPAEVVHIAEEPVKAAEKVAVDFHAEFEHVMDGFENNILMEGVSRLYALWAKLKAAV
jgi:hypothetical protein